MEKPTRFWVEYDYTVDRLSVDEVYTLALAVYNKLKG